MSEQSSPAQPPVPGSFVHAVEASPESLDDLFADFFNSPSRRSQEVAKLVGQAISSGNQGLMETLSAKLKVVADKKNNSSGWPQASVLLGAIEAVIVPTEDPEV